ncbi:hypothetical protein BKA69DRAFT_792338 [Paraphysoderma sedebokerense]|nr:hypothetical protein BKA69DRAFT_792338 [Paraphysoderma sedebokerense]
MSLSATPISSRTHIPAIPTSESLKECLRSLQSLRTTPLFETVSSLFHPKATFSHPFGEARGLQNVYNIYRLYSFFNVGQFEFDDIVIDKENKKVVIVVNQKLKWRWLPILMYTIPTVSVLRFVESEQESAEGNIEKKWLVIEQIDHWSVYGFLWTIPIVSFLYESLVRPFTGLMMVIFGGMIDWFVRSIEKVVSGANYIQDEKLIEVEHRNRKTE